MNSTRPKLLPRRVLSTFGTLAILASFVCHPGAGQDLKSVDGAVEDRLSLAEEEFAYATKNPTDRVAAFLKICDRKMEAARKLGKAGSSEDIARCLRGYGSALQGAVTAVSWGEDRGTNMQRQADAIRKVLRKHAAILKKLETAASPGQQASILQARAALANAEVAEPLR